MAQLFDMLAGINNKMDDMEENTQTLLGGMQRIGRGLQAGTARMLAITGEKMATPRAGSNELKGSAPAGEDRVSRETCWARRVKVTETVTQREKLSGVTETCTSETGRQVTELTGTRETVEERLHGVKEKGDAHAHTHTRVVEDNGGELAERVGTRCEQLGSLPRERGEGVCPLEAGHDQVDSVVPREVEGVSAADGCTRSLGGMKTSGALVEARVPSVSVPVCVVASVVPVCVVSRCVYTSVAKCVL